MNELLARLATVVVFALIAFCGGLWLGHAWGGRSAARELGALHQQVDTLTGERDAARTLANTNAGNLLALKRMLGQEKTRAQQAQQAAETELAQRADRIAALSRAAAARKTTLQAEARTDADCTALRHQPVCAAFARVLWGREQAADAH